jgi:acyl dehydratase
MAAREAAPKSWKGRCFEDFDVGDVYRSRLGRTITDADNLLFSCLTMNTNRTHLDAELCRRTEFGQILVNIVKMRTRGINQRGEVVCEFLRTFMSYRRDAPEAADDFPETSAPWTVGT